MPMLKLGLRMARYSKRRVGAMGRPREEGNKITLIKPSKGLIRLPMRELWEHRELLYFLTWRDIKVRYKQAVLGVLWAFIQPFLKMVVFSIIFGTFARMDSEGYPYPIFLYAGLLPWQFFADAVNRSGNSVVGSANLITKVYFPRLILPIASVGAALVDFAISFGVLIGLMVFYKMAPTIQILMVFPLILATIMTALGVGVFVSALNVAYRDFRYIVPVFVQIWMYVTPVVYAVTIIPDRWYWLVRINPMGGIVDAYRSAMLGKPFDWSTLGISLAVSLGMLLVGLGVFRKTERFFADII
ncbi:ABC transporter permease [Candidatus Bipolaricaulota bacterium]